LSDNGPSYVAGDLATWLREHSMDHLRGAPFHPQTQGKIERFHQTLKNCILRENYYLPGDLEAEIAPSSPTTTTCDTTRQSPTSALLRARPDHLAGSRYARRDSAAKRHILSKRG
jgi:hypothetical protein